MPLVPRLFFTHAFPHFSPRLPLAAVYPAFWLSLFLTHALLPPLSVYPTFWLSRFFCDMWMLFPREDEYLTWFKARGEEGGKGGVSPTSLKGLSHVREEGAGPARQGPSVFLGWARGGAWGEAWAEADYVARLEVGATSVCLQGGAVSAKCEAGALPPRRT